MSKMIALFPNSDLRSGHNGLSKLARKHNYNPEEIPPGGLIVFLNRAQTAFKAYAANQTIIHYKHQRGMLDIKAIQYLPHCLGAGKLAYDKALGIVLEKTLKKRS